MISLISTRYVMCSFVYHAQFHNVWTVYSTMSDQNESHTFLDRYNDGNKLCHVYQGWKKANSSV